MQAMHEESNINDSLSGAPSSTFPQKLFSMSLQEFDEGEVIHWLPHGLAFKVVDSDKFSEEVIPKYFKHTKLTSFQRQLNLYGFRRITKGDDHGAYFHPNFQRGRKDLISNIRRLPAKVNRYSMDSFSNENDSSNRYATITDSDAMDSFEMPPKKRPSIHQSEESFCDESSPSFFSHNDYKGDSAHFPEGPSVYNPHSHKRPASHMSQKPSMGISGSTHSNSHSGYPSAMPLPTMSKLTMNIGYAKHLATSTSAQNSNHQTGQAILEPSQYSSYNLLSNKRLHGPAGMKDSLSLGNGQLNDPFSYQQAHLEIRESQQPPAVIDYPLQSPQLNSMYANSANSSSINDFKLLMAQTSISDFSNWNDGAIWQQRALSHASSSSNSLFSEDDSFQQSHDYDEAIDNIPSFDEAMDMMMASR